MPMNINSHKTKPYRSLVLFVFNFKIALIGLLLVSGCGGPTTKVIEGSITVDGQQPDRGEVRFVPIEGTNGPANVSLIADGRYSMDAHGGVLLGKYRVELMADKKTGRQVMQHNGFEMAMSDEFVQISPKQYSGKQSPLTVEVTAEFENPFDINIQAMSRSQ